MHPTTSMSVSKSPPSTGNTNKKLKGKETPEAEVEKGAEAKREEVEVQHQERWTTFLVRAERQLRMYRMLLAIVLSNSVVFIAAAYIMQPPSTSTASHKAFVVTAFFSLVSLVYNICIIPGIQRLVPPEPTIRPVFPQLLFVAVLSNVFVSSSFMVALAFRAWEHTASVGLLIFQIVFNVLVTITSLLGHIFIDRITISHDV
ncbi:uncharacterized protein F5891DRAFT_158554 [Suillus fuscotomentosus]|uniref:Uncharacterized protein n=1 Tax=Suillus fuscotomentosus TaxID=1912939 RepID=A0AAD4HN19_9AGAM|nr:uncharacterized protein F5891DRAFT_158554 [Suillus fuscotomentosus]KAG1902306.1 hypothetical protein F5891DRAFT_158554 [Suillus fuscotomentosus]